LILAVDEEPPTEISDVANLYRAAAKKLAVDNFCAGSVTRTSQNASYCCQADRDGCEMRVPDYVAISVLVVSALWMLAELRRGKFKLWD
jgi:hypothetical protein